MVIGLEMETYNMVLTEKRQKYLHYNQVKNDKRECLTSEDILPFDQRRVIERVTNSPLGKLWKNKQQ